MKITTDQTTPGTTKVFINGREVGSVAGLQINAKRQRFYTRMLVGGVLRTGKHQPTLQEAIDEVVRCTKRSTDK